MSLCSRQKRGDRVEESRVRNSVEGIEISIQDGRVNCRDCKKEAAVEMLKMFVIVQLKKRLEWI